MAKKNSGASAADKKFDPVKAKPYNRYNIYFILERERLLQANPNYNRKDACAEICITGYENMDLPHHPKQYGHLDLAADWYMPGKYKRLYVLLCVYIALIIYNSQRWHVIMICLQ